jgi:hypothetical protein
LAADQEIFDPRFLLSNNLLGATRFTVVFKQGFEIAVDNRKIGYTAVITTPIQYDIADLEDIHKSKGLGAITNIK